MYVWLSSSVDHLSMLCGTDHTLLCLQRRCSVTIILEVVNYYFIVQKYQDCQYNRLWGTIIWCGKYMILLYANQGQVHMYRKIGTRICKYSRPSLIASQLHTSYQYSTCCIYSQDIDYFYTSMLLKICMFEDIRLTHKISQE